MAKTNVRGTQIADGTSGIDLTVDVFGTLPVANGGTGASTLTASRFLVGNGTSVVDLSKVIPTGAVIGDTDAQTLTNKTFTSPRIGSGVLDVNGVTLLATNATVSAVNNLSVYNAITGGDPVLAAEGTDTNININLVTKGSGTLKLNGSPLASGGDANSIITRTLLR